MRRMLLLIVLAALACPAAASDKFIVHDDQPMDAARRPAAGSALIYFVRTQKMGSAVKFKLYGNGRFLGLVQSQTFLPVEVKAGRYEFVTAAENAGFLNAEVSAGRIYVVQVSVHMGAMKARTHFEVVRPGSEAMQEFLKNEERLRAVTTTDEGLNWVKEDDADIQETIQKYRQKGNEIETLKPEDGFTSPPWAK